MRVYNKDKTGTRPIVITWSGDTTIVSPIGRKFILLERGMQLPGGEGPVQKTDAYPTDEDNVINWADIPDGAKNRILQGDIQALYGDIMATEDAMREHLDAEMARRMRELEAVEQRQEAAARELVAMTEESEKALARGLDAEKAAQAAVARAEAAEKRAAAAEARAEKAAEKAHAKSDK